MNDLADQFLSHLKAIWRYRWYAVVFAWIFALGGWIAVYLMPDRYEASARVHVDTDSVLRPLLSGLAVQPNVEQIVLLMSQSLISRPNLEKVIRMADLEAGLKTDQDRAQLITHLAKALSVNSAGSKNTYTISYANKDPQVAKRVVQSLLTLFVEGSLGDKRKDSDAARNFIDQQLNGYSERLVAAENAITEFKRQHMGIMPGEARDYYARLTAAKIALNGAELELKEAENSRDAIRKQLAGDAKSPALEGDNSVVSTEIDVRIQALEQKLDSLRLTYTEQHPDIVAIIPVIARLKEQKEAEAKVRKTSPGPVQAKSPVYQQLTLSLTTAEAKVAGIEARVAEYSKRYNELQAGANAVPQVEAEFTQLTRDYEVDKTRYDELLRRRETAQISGDVEATDAALDFRVIDPPHVPLTPSAPNRPLLMTIVLLGALAGGLGVALLISQIRPTFNDERALGEASGLQVLGTVVMAWTDAQKSRRTRGLFALLLSFLSLLSAYVGIMATLVLTMSRV